MSTYFLAPDAYGDWWVWAENPDAPNRPRPKVSRIWIDDDFLWARLTDGLEVRP